MTAPLASPTREWSFFAAGQLAPAAAASAWIVARAGWSELAAFVLGGSIYGALMWRAAYRPRLDRDLDDWRPAPPDAPLEPPWRIAGRTAVALVPLLVLLGLIILLAQFGTVVVPVGILAGNGAATAAGAWRLRRWERDRGARLLRSRLAPISLGGPLYARFDPGAERPLTTNGRAHEAPGGF